MDDPPVPPWWWIFVAVAVTCGFVAAMCAARYLLPS
jgi:hypothetical protein